VDNGQISSKLFNDFKISLTNTVKAALVDYLLSIIIEIRGGVSQTTLLPAQWSVIAICSPRGENQNFYPTI